MAGPTSAGASFAGANGVIAYSTSDGLWVVEPLSGDQRQVTTIPGDAYPSFSPSGDLLAFQRRVDHKAYVYLASSDGSGAHALIAGREPSFSPTGDRIVFVDGRGLAVIGLRRGESPRQLTHDPRDRLPRWSTRNQIVFERGAELYVFPIARPSPSLVLTLKSEGQQGARFADWSPDGSTLAVAACTHALPRHASERLPTSPPIVLHTSCDPVVWAPAGRGVAELGSGALAGPPFTQCPQQSTFEPSPFAPEMEPSPIAWQSLHNGSRGVQTLPCSAVYEPGYQTVVRCELFEACQGGGPEHGTAVCWKRHGRKKCVTVA
jgi:dipeptidyl aminopeptidase/acylaminoacyl peptidase